MKEIDNPSVKKGSGWLFKIIIILILLAVGFGGWKYFSQKDTNFTDQTGNVQQTATDKATQAEMEKATEELLAKVGKLIVLPNEKPTFATVLDAKKLIAEQSFYVGAENGDQLLIYEKAQKAILYSPSRNILVNVGPVYFNNATGTPATDKK